MRGGGGNLHVIESSVLAATSAYYNLQWRASHKDCEKNTFIWGEMLSLYFGN